MKTHYEERIDQALTELMALYPSSDWRICLRTALKWVNKQAGDRPSQECVGEVVRLLLIHLGNGSQQKEEPRPPPAPPSASTPAVVTTSYAAVARASGGSATH